MTYDREKWNDLILELGVYHLLQSWDWGQSRLAAGWLVEPLVLNNEAGTPAVAAQVMTRDLKIGPFSSGLQVVYIPRGPLLDWRDSKSVELALSALEAKACQKRVLFVKIDPEVIIGTGTPQEMDAEEDSAGLAIRNLLIQRGWRCSRDQIQFKNTIWIDLTGTEEEWLARMKQKTRYNLRLAQRKGVKVRQGGVADLPLLYRMYAETATRDGFVIRQQQYYLDLWSRFINHHQATVLIAEMDSQPVAGLVLFHFGERAWYLYGMSTHEHREAMPVYLLQWEAMRAARDFGCTIYDLWGAPDDFNPDDPLWGVYRFKLGWGGQVIRTIGAWDFTARPQLYSALTTVAPALLSILRFLRRRQTRREASA